MKKILSAAILSLSLVATSAAADPLHFSKLIEQLPAEDAFAGFTRQKPEGSTTNAMGFHTTVVSAMWENSDDSAQTIRVQYTDGAPTEFVTTAFTALSQFSQESTEGYEKGVKLGEFQAIESYRTEEKSGSLSVVIGTVLVQIETQGQPAEALRTAWAKVPAPAILAATKAK
jgi:hypothetical protein